MFKRLGSKDRRGSKVNRLGAFAGAFIGFEVLEDRRLMSAGPRIGGPPIAAPCHGAPGAGQQITQIAFSLIPTAAQTGLDSLATTDGLSAPTSTQSVTLGNVNGIETYSLTIDSTGTVSTLTVDASGNPVTAPTTSTTTWATLNGTGTGSDSAAASEITAIASALDLTSPTDTTTINVVTTSDGTTTYSLQLSPSSDSSSDTDNFHGSQAVNISVFASGDPTGNQSLPFSVLPASIQTAINDNVPSGATALSLDSTQSVQIQVVDGVTLYSTSFTASGTIAQVTVDGAGNLTSLPTHTTTTFGDLSSAQQTELQTLATGEGDMTALTSDQSVDVLTEVNGISLFSVTIPITETNAAGNNATHDETITIDSTGNPTVLPSPGLGGPADGGQGQGQCPPVTQGSGDQGSGGSDQGINPGGPIRGVSSGGSGSGTDSGDPTNVACPAGSGSSNSGSDNSNSSSTTTVSSGAITSSSSDTDSSTKKSSKKTTKTKVAKVTTKKSKTKKA